MQAIILVGGKGTRLKPYTTVLPKPLMPVGGFCILEIVIRQLANAGVDDIVLAVSHLSEIIMAFFGKKTFKLQRKINCIAKYSDI